MSETNRVSALIERLKRKLPEGVLSTGDSDRSIHGRDESFHRESLPDLVAFPSDREQLIAILAAADDLLVPVIPFGAGSSLEGHILAVHGGVSVDLTRMNAIRQIDTDSLSVTLEPGVTRLQLERKVSEYGLMFPIDPGADASLGGMAATNAAGTMTTRYGKMRSNVLALEVILPGGRPFRTGSRASKSSAGYDLTGLLVGSEGTLGVISELTLRLWPIPEASVAVRVSLGSLEAAGELATAMVSSGIGASRVELLDDWEVKALGKIDPGALPDGSTLLIELSGSAAAVQAEFDDLKALLAEYLVVEMVVKSTPSEQRSLWRLRHQAMVGEQAMAPGKRTWSTDVCVPMAGFTEALLGTRDAIDRSPLSAGIVSHAADGNIHVGIMVDPDDPEEMIRSSELAEHLVKIALDLGGTCTGEHGIGLGKLRWLDIERRDSIDLMRSIKNVFDPSGIMNPGKVLPHRGK